MSEISNSYDLIIVGAGPAGTASAIHAHRAGLKSLLIDKSTFPRDKICGDALSGKAVAELTRLGLWQQVRKLPGAAINRIIFSSPDHSRLEIDLSNAGLNQIPEGFVIRRQEFDNFMLTQAKASTATVLEDHMVDDLIWEDGYVAGVKVTNIAAATSIDFRAKLVLGCDGYKSIVSRKVGFYNNDRKHNVIALRQYYENVGDLTDQIELHYIDEVIPGYFWIFPIEDNKANVGIGMTREALIGRDLDLKASLAAAIQSPMFKERFANATPLEEPCGWNLPVGSIHRKNYGDGFLLVGDAAGLIDPFTGEGIGNALYSARYAVEVAVKAIGQNDTSAAFLKAYDKNLWAAIGPELRTSTQLQKLGRWKRLLNLVIGKASRSRELGDLIAGMVANETPKTKLANPLFYLRLLFK